MKLLLTSAGFQNPLIAEEFLKLVDLPAEEIRVLFIPTASRTPEEMVYVEKSRDELIESGIHEENIIDFNFNRKLNDAELMEFDAIYVCGGNTFFLLKMFRENKFLQKIKAFIKRGGVYVGVSAGSIIAGPSIEIAGWGSEGDKNDSRITNLKALNLIDIAIFPHYKHHLKNELMGFRKKVKYSILELNDEQALLINGKEEKIIK